MSVQAMAAVLERIGDDVTGTNRLVLLSLANHASGETGECWPSIETIAREAAVHPDTARRALRWLTAEGWIERVVNGAPDSRIPADRRPNLYRLGDWSTQTGGDDSSLPSRRTPIERGGRSVVHGGDDSSSTGVTNRHPKPSIEPEENPMRPTSGRSASSPPAPERSRSVKQIARDEIFDALREIDGIPPEAKLTRTQGSLLGKLTTELVAVDATGRDVRERARRYRRRHPSWECTAAAVVKHWASLGAPTPRDPAGQRSEGPPVVRLPGVIYDDEPQGRR